MHVSFQSLFSPEVLKSEFVVQDPWRGHLHWYIMNYELTHTETNTPSSPRTGLQLVYDANMTADARGKTRQQQNLNKHDPGGCVSRERSAPGPVKAAVVLGLCTARGPQTSLQSAVWVVPTALPVYSCIIYKFSRFNLGAFFIWLSTVKTSESIPVISGYQTKPDSQLGSQQEGDPIIFAV